METTISEARVDNLAAGHARPANRVAFVSVVLPCLDEASAIPGVVAEALHGLTLAGAFGEVIVVDNGSADDSAGLAAEAGARVIHQPRRGYGAAVAAGIAAATGDVVVMADADASYDLANLGDLLPPLGAGADLVLASRISGRIAPAAMPPLHRFVGTPLLTGGLALLTGVRLSDSQTGYRAFRREAIAGLDLRADGMEYASEMLLRACRAGLRVAEVPTHYRVRLGDSKLRPAGDGWRHLRLLMLLSPHVALIFPGVVAIVLGFLLCGVSLVAPTGLAVGRLRWLPIFLGPMLLILGSQATLLGALAAHRSASAPPLLRWLLAGLGRPGAVNRILGCFAIVALVGIAADVLLLVLWLLGRSGPSLLGVAGLAQALVVAGGTGVATIFAADYARDLLDW